MSVFYIILYKNYLFNYILNKIIGELIMKFKKIIILSFLFSLMSLFLFSNEKNINTICKNFGFVKSYENIDSLNPNLNSNPFNDYRENITHYALSNTQKQKLFLILAFIGVAFLGTSLFFITPGIIQLALSFQPLYYTGPYSFRIFNPSDVGYNLFCAGVGFLTAGLVLFWAIGLPLTIVGFVLYSYYGGKFSMFMENKNKYARMGFSIKI